MYQPGEREWWIASRIGPTVHISVKNSSTYNTRPIVVRMIIKGLPGSSVGNQFSGMSDQRNPPIRRGFSTYHVTRGAAEYCSNPANGALLPGERVEHIGGQIGDVRPVRHGRRGH